MPPLDHITASIINAFRLALGKGDAVNDFDLSPTGFWTSFYATLIVAPFSLIMAMTHFDVINSGIGEFGTRTEPVSAGRFIIVQMINYVISWTVYPVLMAIFVRPLNCTEHYIRGIVSYNWVAVLQNAFYTPVAIFSVTVGPISALPFLAMLAVLAYGWFVAWKGFGITRMQAATLVGLDLSVAIIISFWASRLIHG